MQLSSTLRAALIALIAFAGAGLSSAHADSGTVSLTIYKGGWFIGGSAGGGTLNFRGRSYALSAGASTTAWCSGARRRCCAAG